MLSPLQLLSLLLYVKLDLHCNITVSDLNQPSTVSLSVVDLSYTTKTPDSSHESDDSDLTKL